MSSAVYNSAIPKAIILKVILNSVNPAPRLPFGLFLGLCFVLVTPRFVIAGPGPDWSVPEQQLAKKIVAITGSGATALSVENRSSLSKRESEIVGNGLQAALQTVGLRLVKPELAAATVMISLSENPNAYVWVAQIRRGDSKVAVEIVSVAREQGTAFTQDSVPLTLRKTSVFTQEERILDVLVLEENPTPVRIAVLGADDVSFYRSQGGKWQPEQTLAVVHARPWPRDLRGRLIPGRDHLLDAYLPGVICHSTNGTLLTLHCQESDDPWPLVAGQSGGGTSANFPSYAASTLPAIPQKGAFFAPARNFFPGVVTPAIGNFTTIPKFYSAAFFPRGKSVLWLLAAVDGQIHAIDGVLDQPTKLNWGSDVVSLRTACGAGWQVLATSPGVAGNDSIRAYEFPDRDPVPVSAPIDLAATVTALWAEARGDTAIVVTGNGETGGYEALRLAVACNQ